MRLRRPHARPSGDAEADALREALRVSRASYRSLLESTPEAFAQVDEHGVIVEWNAEAERVFGWSRDEAVGRTLAATVVPERLRESFRGALERFVEDGEDTFLASRQEVDALRRDGEELPVEVTIVAQRLPTGCIFNAFAHDIAERKRRERYLEAQRRLAVVCAAGRPLEETWGELLKAIGEPLGWCVGGAWIVDETREELTCAEFWVADGLAADGLAAQSRAEPLRRGVGAVGIAWERGSTVWIDLRTEELDLPRRGAMLAAGIRSGIAVPLCGAGGIAGALDFFSDEPITENPELTELMRLVGEQVSQFLQRSRAEAALARSAEQLAEAQAIAEVGSWEWGVATGVVLWSDETYRIYGRSRDTFRPSYEGFLDSIDPDDRERVDTLVRASFDTHEPFDFVHRVPMDGGVRVVRGRGRVLLNADGEPERLVGTAQDMTASVAAEEKLRETQKLESLGVLAGGVAHDFNNLLVGILGNASLARTSVEPGSELDRLLEQVELAGERAAELSQQMLAYSGRGSFAPVSRDLRAAVAEMAQLLAAAIPENVGVDLDFEDDVPPIHADSAQLTQVLMNLLTNAAEAIGTARGTVRVRVELRDVDAATLATFSYVDGAVPGRYVALEVADTGVGMPEETVSRIFEPFFTTKFSGRGLGLAAVLGIVRGHGGAVKVASTLGKGTTFTVIWPPAP